jgi:outer membrane protein assembly factor BamB
MQAVPGAGFLLQRRGACCIIGGRKINEDVMTRMDPIRSPGTAISPAVRQAAAPAAPAPIGPQDTVDTSGALPKGKGIDFSKASKILDYKSGSLGSAVTLWKFDAKHYDATAFVSGGGHFYEGGLDGTLRRFSPDGAIMWEKKCGHNGLSVAPAVAPDGTAFVSRVVSLEAYNPDGTLKWDVPLPGPENMDRNSLSLKCSAGPEGNVYIHDATKLYAVDPNGKTAWKKDIQAAWSDNPPIVGPDRNVYAADRRNTVYAFDSTGKQLWKNTEMTKDNPVLPDITTALAVGPDGSVVFGTRNTRWDVKDCRLVALDGQGKIKWSLPTDGELSNYEEPSIDQATGTIYAGSGRDCREVWAVSPEGNLLWKKEIGSILHVTAVPGGKGVIVGIKGGDLHAFDEKGNQIWTFHTGSIFTRPSFAPDGTVFVGSNETMYALKTRDEYLRKRMEEQKKEVLEAPDEKRSPAVEQEQGWIIIDGVKLPVRK